MAINGKMKVESALKNVALADDQILFRMLIEGYLENRNDSGQWKVREAGAYLAKRFYGRPYDYEDKEMRRDIKKPQDTAKNLAALDRVQRGSGVGAYELEENVLLDDVVEWLAEHPRWGVRSMDDAPDERTLDAVAMERLWIQVKKSKRIKIDPQNTVSDLKLMVDYWKQGELGEDLALVLVHTDGKERKIRTATWKADRSPAKEVDPDEEWEEELKMRRAGYEEKV